MIVHYVDAHAPVLLMLLGADGKICHVNRFAGKTIGERLPGMFFHDIIMDFHDTFQLEKAAACSDTVHLLTLQTKADVSQTYRFRFYKTQHAILALGHLDIDEIESLSSELLSVNRELNNLTRELNFKNRDLLKANEKIIELTRMDPLTKLANRRYFSERMEEMISLAARKSQPLSLIMTDIDHFKCVNDTDGHDAGDRVLQGYADLMKAHTRVEDLVARFGGEEFIILLPSTDSFQAHASAERIRLALASMDFLKNNQHVTASFGVSQLIPGENSDTFIKRTDVALYQAKNSGRNRTVMSDGHLSRQ